MTNPYDESLKEALYSYNLVRERGDDIKNIEFRKEILLRNILLKAISEARYEFYQFCEYLAIDTEDFVNIHTEEFSSLRNLYEGLDFWNKAIDEKIKKFI
jgi:hypothetical protein